MSYVTDKQWLTKSSDYSVVIWTKSRGARGHTCGVQGGRLGVVLPVSELRPSGSRPAPRDGAATARSGVRLCPRRDYSFGPPLLAVAAPSQHKTAPCGSSPSEFSVLAPGQLGNFAQRVL